MKATKANDLAFAPTILAKTLSFYSRWLSYYLSFVSIFLSISFSLKVLLPTAKTTAFPFPFIINESVRSIGSGFSR